jgi:hypothetical protein
MAKYSVVTNSLGNRFWANGGRGELSLESANRVAVLEQARFQQQNKYARIEVIQIKDNGQHGETVAVLESKVLATKG